MGREIHPSAAMDLGLIKQLGASETWLPFPGGSLFRIITPGGEGVKMERPILARGLSGPRLMPARILASLAYVEAYILKLPCDGSQANL